ncbi:hypothetical protein EDB80DRAFT_701100 [Ilyonectria destructans]|nr:hypothetical protein EDB80DRAFT_701100 [Ilyonectria destructans]
MACGWVLGVLIARVGAQCAIFPSSPRTRSWCQALCPRAQSLSSLSAKLGFSGRPRPHFFPLFPSMTVDSLRTAVMKAAAVPCWPAPSTHATSPGFLHKWLPSS